MMARLPFPKIRSRYGYAGHIGRLAIVMVLLSGVGCATTPQKDPVSLQNAVTLKAEALALIEKATDPPDVHLDEIRALRQKLQAALEYERKRAGSDAITVKQWELLIDPNGNLLGGFLAKWEAEGKGRTPAFLEGVKKIVAEAFDQLIKVQSP